MSETLTAQDQLLFEQLAASQLVGEQRDAGGGLGLGLQGLLRRQSSHYDESVHGRRVVEMTEAQRTALADFLQAADEEAEPPQRLSFDARLLISELEVCVHVSDFFPETAERNRTLAAAPPPPPPGRPPKPARVTLVASAHNVGLNVGGRPDGCLADVFWETVPNLLTD